MNSTYFNKTRITTRSELDTAIDAWIEDESAATTTYGDIARKLRTSPRAVGGALGKNNLMMTVPCHRVVGSDGKLTGFTSVGGLSTKRNLLNIEQKTKK